MKLWGGRFSKETDKLAEDFHSSIGFDRRLYRYDIAGSKAHARMLGACDIISAGEADMICHGLEAVLQDLENGQAELTVEAEDIHMNIEQLLIAKIGETGKKLHTARSRNDQVALDMRLYVKDQLAEVSMLLLDLETTLLELAAQQTATIMPGYTHLQKAQPITLAHHLLAYQQMFSRDLERLKDCYHRTDVLPLGSGALAGTTFPIDREMVARELGFNRVSLNSLDAVSDRDFVVEFLFVLSLAMTHLSRFCEEIILWATDEFRFIKLDDAYSTGSSIMPQKKNPDVAELIRGKTGRVYGHLMALLAVLKSLPLAYNKDLQEDKEALFDAVDTVKKCLLTFRPMLETAAFDRARLYQGAGGGYTNATDVADYLVRKGVPFREAHAVVGRSVLACEHQGKPLSELTLEEWQQFDPRIEKDIYEAISLEACVQRRNVTGGPAAEAVEEIIARSREINKEVRESWSNLECLKKNGDHV